jgi:hypothetical protein
MTIIIVIVVVFQGLGLLAYSGSELFFSETYEFFGQLVGLHRRGSARRKVSA